MLRALIIDDERLARSALRRLLREHDEVEIVGEAANSDEAVRAIHKLSPDLLFLDVEMPAVNGFDLLEKLDDVPTVIFTTAYDQYAVRAFEISALDYLVKPITRERLSASLARAQSVAATLSRTRPFQQIFVRD